MVAEPQEAGAPAPEVRPRVHFTPPSGWLNDPNGLVHADGVYHLCYQHHPADVLWGPMHWGHATSRDLLTWEHQPVALVPDHLGAAFSGSAVVDHEGVAGFGHGALVAFYTHFLEETPQSQGVAWSTDGGTTWHSYRGNPVLAAPAGLVDFRDPKVLRLPGHDRPWVMVLVAGEEVLFYRSRDLLTWSPSGRFGAEYGAHGGVWETPDLFELEVEGASHRRWVLTVSVQDGGPAGGSATQYFLGDFDGDTFACDDPPGTVRWVDHGADFYAPQTWFDAPDERRICLAWMSNWRYARLTPASGWRGAMTVPRDLRLVERGGRTVLAQRPVAELESRAAATGTLDGPVAGERVLAEGLVAGDVRVSWPAGGACSFLLEVRRSVGVSRIRYDAGRRVLVVEPSPAGLPPGCRTDRQEVPLTPEGEELDLRVVVDATSVEVFADRGTVVLTNQVFGGAESTLVLTAEGADADAMRVSLRGLGGPEQDRGAGSPHDGGAPA